MQQHYHDDQDYTDERIENPSVFAELLNSPLAMTPATTGQRILNYVVDLVAFYIIIFVFAIAYSMIAAFSGNQEMVNDLDSPWTTVVSFLILLSYYFIMESLTGRTMGKLVTRTKVVMEDGSKLTAKAVMQRTLSRLIPFEAFTFFGSGPGLHDRLANTRVVKAS
ncbi:RDD family protein [Hymenobacter sp. BT186]|uniref:RDD family protein n=1 Tax=Hymenobacter telluris TaxID=2816474 RepID=A0A939JCW2_9BACT|nr:RDD family protein [Hymenobacter telluris]MBO0358780.1 RDD family protein [Hymenobacter telluris]MBW3374806.1 RDD family protein [Hymenobacter norwichensis]